MIDSIRRSARNATKHGLAGQGISLLPEDQALLEHRLRCFAEEVGAVGALEHEYVAVAAHASVRRRRAEISEAQNARERVMALPRAGEHLIRDHVKFRVGRLVFVSIAPDERSMGFGFPKEERAALVASEPHKFHMPAPSDERDNWVRVWLDAIDQQEMEELVVEAWRMVVPKRVAAAHPGP